MLFNDIQKSELNFKIAIANYFSVFAQTFFERVREFWRVFVDIMTTIFSCVKQDIIDAIDCLASKLLYNSEIYPIEKHEPSIGQSEAIEEYLEKMAVPRIESLPQEVPLQISEDNKITTSEIVDDNQFITLLPGFIMHNEEVRSENGIPREVLAITDDCCVVDLRNSGFKFIRDLKRGFHFNCIVKMIRVDGKICVALYATRLKGPLLDDKARRWYAIQSGNELVLPFDGRIPFPTKKTEWKENRYKLKASKPKEVAPPPVKQKKGGKNISNQNAQKMMLMFH
jgi:hypothetical protein